MSGFQWSSLTGEKGEVVKKWQEWNDGERESQLNTLESFNHMDTTGAWPLTCLVINISIKVKS